MESEFADTCGSQLLPELFSQSLGPAEPDFGSARSILRYCHIGGTQYLTLPGTMDMQANAG